MPSARILIAQTSFLGDVVLTTALAQAIAAARSDAEVHWLVRPSWAPLLEPDHGVDRVMRFDKRGDDRGLGGLRRMARRIREKNFDLAIGAQRSARTSVLLAAARVPERIGYADSGASWLYHHRIPRDEALHARDRLAALAGPLGGAGDPAGPWLPRLTVDRAAAERVDTVLRDHQVRDGDRLVVVAPGSAWATKRWPPASFARAASALLPAYGDRVVIVGGHDDAGPAAEVASALGGEAVGLVGRTDVAELAAVLARASVVLANDSGAAHVAGAVGTPVVAVFGPTAPEQGFAPLGLQAAVVQADLGCRPCSRHGGPRCPIGTHECMAELPAEWVAAAARRMLESPGGSGADA